MSNWNPWHGCHKISAGCKNCYVYRQDIVFGKDSNVVIKTSNFDLPLKKDKKGKYKIQNNKNGFVYTCLTSDFFIEDADKWRNDIWKMIKFRRDLNFFIITKRVDRFNECIPSDWNEGYENVIIGCTVENQQMADYRLPIFLNLPIKKKIIVCSPLLEKIDLKRYLNSSIINVGVGGESGQNARICDYEWVLNIRNQCIDYNIDFYFIQTGTHFKKGDKIYCIPRKVQKLQAQKAGIDTAKPFSVDENFKDCELIKWF